MHEHQQGVRNVWLISIAFFFIFAGFNSAQQYLTVIFEQQGREDLALLSILVLYGTFMATGVFISKAIPLLGGLKRSLVIGAATYALFCASVAVSNAAVLLLASIVIGAGAGLIWVSSAQIIADSSEKNTAGRHFGFQATGQFGGMVLGLFLSSYLLQTVSVTVTYLILAACACIGVVLLTRVQPLREESPNRPFRPFFLFDARMLCLFPILAGSSYALLEMTTALNFVVIAALGAAALPIVISAARIGNMVGTLTAGTLSDRYSKKLILVILTLGGLASMGGALITDDFVFLLGSALLFGSSMSAAAPVVLAWLKESLPQHEYLDALGTVQVYNTLGAVAAAGANLALSYTASFVPGAIILVIALPCLALFHAKTRA